MGWPKGKPRKPKVTDPLPSEIPQAKGKRDPARKLKAEIAKVLKQLEAWRTKVAELEKTVADMTQALTGAVPRKVRLPTELIQTIPLDSSPPAPLAPQDQEEGRWV